MARNAKYFVLFTDTGEGFAPQFGDWSRACVEQERRDTYKGERFRIEAFFPNDDGSAPYQGTIAARAMFLNRGGVAGDVGAHKPS